MVDSVEKLWTSEAVHFGLYNLIQGKLRISLHCKINKNNENMTDIKESKPGK